MQFIETRGNDGFKSSSVPFSQAILSPSASYGGLYVPQSLPNLNQDFLMCCEILKDLSRTSTIY